MKTLLETIRIVNGKIPLFKYHYSRLASGLALQAAAPINAEDLQQEIINHLPEGVVRLIIEPGMQASRFYIEKKEISINDDAFWMLGVHEIYIQPQDCWHGIKITERDYYNNAQVFAKEIGVNEVLVASADGAIIEGAISNLFWINQGQVFTPAIGQYGVNGAMRRYLLDYLANQNPIKIQDCVKLEELYNADEIFMTNAVRGIIPVTGLVTKLDKYSFPVGKVSQKLREEINSDAFV